ncbi:MAG: transporter [Planctomycetes bacterium]|nr:transporter [Planctomycetota bacterium]
MDFVSYSSALLALLAFSGTVQAQEDDPLVGDRPDFTEASSTVGMHRLQIEGGYTYSYDRTSEERLDEHGLPELLLRYGLTDKLEFRLGWSGYTFSRARDLLGGGVTTDAGGSDLEIGAKMELTEQGCCCPESAILTSITAPTGDPAFSSGQVDAAVNLVYSSEVTDWLALGGSTGSTWTAEEDDQFALLHQSLVAGFGLTDRLGSYFEWFAFFPDGAEDNRPQHFLDSGFTYLVSPNFQLDWHAGIGLNDASTDFFTGTGFIFRR